jgi:hypothetical protein
MRRLETPDMAKKKTASSVKKIKSAAKSLKSIAKAHKALELRIKKHQKQLSSMFDHNI